MLKEQQIMPQSKEIQEQMRNKIFIRHFPKPQKGYIAISKALGLQRTTSEPLSTNEENLKQS